MKRYYIALCLLCLFDIVIIAVDIFYRIDTLYSSLGSILVWAMLLFILAKINLNKEKKSIWIYLSMFCMVLVILMIIYRMINNLM